MKNNFKNLTSIYDGHIHSYMIDKNGNGRTMELMNEKPGEFHEHLIENFNIIPVEDGDGHVHVLETNNNLDIFKLHTHEVHGVEIFEAGKWKGNNYSINDLDKVITNFNEGVIEPYLNIDHSDEATGEFKKALKAMSLGVVKKLYRNGKKLIADFKKVPKTIAELIEAGPLNNRSVELWHEYPHANGNVYKMVLEAVTFHGANGVPAVNTLSDFVALYKDKIPANNSREDNERITIHYKREDKPMDTIEVKKSEYDSLVTMKGESEKKDSTIETLKGDTEKVKTESESLKKENDDLKKFKKEAEENQAKALETEAETYIDDKIKDGKIMPASKDMYVNQYKQFKAEGEDQFKTFKNDIDSRINAIFQNTKEVNGSNPQVVEDVEDIQKKIEMKMNADTTLTFEKARADVLSDAEKIISEEV